MAVRPRRARAQWGHDRDAHRLLPPLWLRPRPARAARSPASAPCPLVRRTLPRAHASPAADLRRPQRRLGAQDPARPRRHLPARRGRDLPGRGLVVARRRWPDRGAGRADRHDRVRGPVAGPPRPRRRCRGAHHRGVGAGRAGRVRRRERRLAGDARPTSRSSSSSAPRSCLSRSGCASRPGASSPRRSPPRSASASGSSGLVRTGTTRSWLRSPCSASRDSRSSVGRSARCCCRGPRRPARGWRSSPWSGSALTEASEQPHAAGPVGRGPRHRPARRRRTACCSRGRWSAATMTFGSWSAPARPRCSPSPRRSRSSTRAPPRSRSPRRRARWAGRSRPARLRRGGTPSPRVPLAGSLLVLVPVPATARPPAASRTCSTSPTRSPPDWLVRLDPEPHVANPLLLPLAVAVVGLAAALTVPRPPRFRYAILRHRRAHRAPHRGAVPAPARRLRGSARAVRPWCCVPQRRAHPAGAGRDHAPRGVRHGAPRPARPRRSPGWCCRGPRRLPVDGRPPARRAVRPLLADRPARARACSRWLCPGSRWRWSPAVAVLFGAAERDPVRGRPVSVSLAVHLTLAGRPGHGQLAAAPRPPAAGLAGRAAARLGHLGAAVRRRRPGARGVHAAHAPWRCCWSACTGCGATPELARSPRCSPGSPSPPSRRCCGRWSTRCPPAPW